MIPREGVRVYVAYFDRNLSRRVRRVPITLAVQSPTLKEIEEACRALGYRFTSLPSRHSAVWWMDEGAVEVTGVKKAHALKAIANEVLKIRASKEARKN
ncbi:MAG: signal recognition particle subunit SRP19/SEC65 family protein [Thermoprotei archaeon]